MHFNSDGTSRPSTSAIVSSSLANIAPSSVLPDDPPNPARAKLGPLGQIIHGSTATAASKKKGKGKEIINENKAETETVVKKESKKKKFVQDVVEETFESNPGAVEVNGTSPKKKPKTTGTKKPINGNSKPAFEVPPAIIASA